MESRTMPLWLSISKQLENDIDSGKFASGLLPTELELCDLYLVSRITVRGAMARLVDLGKVKRIKGKGTIIMDEKIKEPLLKISGFTQEMKESGIIPSTSFAHVKKVEASGYVSELFGVSARSEFLMLERVRCINDVPLGYFVTYLPTRLNLSVNDEDYYTSLYERLKNECGIVIDRVQQTISAEIPDKRTKEMLNLLQGEPVMVMKRRAYCRGELIEYSICKYDSKRYEYKFELKNDI